MGYITKIEDYWIAPSAVNISLNAMGDPNRIQGSVASGAVISCYIDGIPGLELDNGRNPKRWPLSLTPTYFNSFTEKYIYAAIPRSTEVGTMAVIVFPSELIYLDGTNEAGIQVGSEDYYYVWLQGIISATDGYLPRTRTAECDFGSLGTYEDIVSVKDVDWYSYDKLTQIVTFLKGIVMKPGSSFYNLILGGKEVKGVATADTSAYYIDSDTLVATPGYLHANYLNKKAEDTAEEQIGFLKGLWIGVKGLYEITADGMGKFKSLFAESVNAQRVQADEMQSSNFTGDGIADTGWRLTNNYNGHSKLTVDELYVRMKAVFESLEVKKEMVTGGNQIFSRAANVICRTDYFDANGDRIGYSEVKVPWLLRGLSMVLSKRILNGIYSRSKSVRVNISDTSQIATIRCYFLAEEGGRKVNNLWSIEGGHDLARCQTFNLNRSERTSYVDGENVKLGNVFWWRKVVGVSSNSNPVEIDGKKYHYFDVSNQSGGYLAGSDLPCAGDEVSQWGNDGNEDRMHLVTIEVDGGVAIKAYEGIYTFDMSKCWYGGNPCKMNLSPQNEYRFTGRSFKIETEYGIRPVPVDIDVDWASQTKSRAEYAETGVSVGQLIIKNYYYDRLPHNGSLWLCLFSGSTYWARYAKYDAGVISYVTEDVFNTLPDSQKLYVRVSGRTGLADNQVCRRMEYTSAEPGTNSAVWHQEVAKGQNGIDAQDVEWVYIRTKTNEAPVILSDSTYTDHNGHTYTADDHLPRVTGNANIENNEGVYECTDDPKGVDDTWKYEWEIKRSKGAASDGHRAWNYYQGAMTLHNNLAESAFIIDTDNDNDQFGTDSESIVLVTQTRQTVVALYDGSTQQSLTNLTAVLTFDDGTSVPSGVATVSANASTGVVEVTVLQNSTPINHSEIQATITATCAKGSKQTTFSLRKVMGGAPGLNPIIYQLVPTQKAFPFARTSTNALTPNSQVSQINVSRTEGNTTTILTTAQTGITYQWGFDDSTTPEETNKSVGSTITVTKAQAALHSKVWIKLSTGDRETLPIVKDGAKGDPGNNGDTPVQAFQWNQSATTAPSPLPSGANLGDWSLTAPDRPSGDGEYFLWMTQTVKHVSVNGTVTYDTWSDPVRISGNNGTNGEDGTDYEYIYILKTAQYTFPTNEKPANISTGEVSPGGHAASGIDTNKQQDDWVPKGWWDNPQGIDSTNKFEYMSLRTKPKGSNTWGAFSDPFIWSHWGRNGMDGDGTEYVFIRTKNNVPPVMDSTQSGYTADEFRPTITAASQAASDTEQAQTTDDPKGTNETYQYEWVAKRNMSAPDASGQRTWRKFTGENNDYKMSLWSNYAEDGKNSIRLALDNEHEDFLYSDSQALPIAPSGGATSAIHLYDGETELSSGFTLEVDFTKSSGIPGSSAQHKPTISNGVLTVPHITADAAKVVVKATYKSKYYYAGFTANKTSQDKYDLKLVPNAIAFNTSDTWADKTITPSAERTDIQGNKTTGLTIQTSAADGLRLYYSYVNANGSLVTPSLNLLTTSTFTLTETPANTYIGVYFELRLYSGNSYRMCDYETVEIVKTANGQTGPAGTSVIINGDATYFHHIDSLGNPRPLNPTIANLGEVDLLDYDSITGDMIDVCEEIGTNLYGWEAYSVPVGTCYLFNKKLYEATENGWLDLGQFVGDNGEDGVTLLISPASLIVNQDLNNPDNLSNLTQTFVVAVYKGSVPQTVNGISFTAETVPSSYPTAYKGLFLNSSSQRVGSGNVNGNILTLKQINTYTQGQQTLYYDNFYADLVVNYGNLKTISGRVRIYANLLGTWKQTIEGDVSTEMAQRIAYLYDPNNPNQVVKQETFGEYVRSSTENMSKLSKAIMSRNIMPMTGWTDITGDPYPETGSEHFDPYTQELEAEEPFSRAVALEANKNYCFSIYTDSNTVPSLYLLDENGSPGSEVYFDEMTAILYGDTIKVGNITYYRHYIVFDISDEGLPSGNYLIGPYVDASVNLFYRPQLETGSTPTDYGIPTLRYDSEIYQNAEQIDMSVSKNEMEQAGIHINGSNSTIDLVAGRVNFKMPGGGTNTKISIGSDGRLNAVDGNFEGTVRATNFYQQMSVFYEGKSYGSTITQLEDYSYFRYYCKEGFTEGGVTYIQGRYYESYPSGYGNKFERCTYDAEVIDLIPNPESQWDSDIRVRTCYLPDPKDFVGKVVRVYAPEIGTLNGSPYIDCVVRTVSPQAQNIAKFAKWIYLDSGAIKAVSSVVEQRDVVAPGTQAIYQAIYADGDNKYYWLKLL